MLADIFNVPAVVSIDGKEYKAEYDFKGYATLETLTGKGWRKLYNLLMVQNDLTLNDSIELICCSLLKHHTTAEVTEVRKYLTLNIYEIDAINNQIIWVFTSPLLPPDVVNDINDAKKKVEEAEKSLTASSIG